MQDLRKKLYSTLVAGINFLFIGIVIGGAACILFSFRHTW